MKTDIEQIKDSKTRNIYNEKSSNISLNVVLIFSSESFLLTPNILHASS